MNFPLKEHTVLLTVAGSRCYGIHTKESDVDVKGILIPPKRFYFGLDNFEQCESASEIGAFFDVLNAEEKQAASTEKLEGVIYELRKFIRLASDCNPNILDVLFCRDSEVRWYSAIGDKLRENAEFFLSARAKHTYSGYAISQLKRIKTHYAWHNSNISEPTRKQFGLPETTLIPKDQIAAAEAAIQKKIDSWNMTYDNLSDSEKIDLDGRIRSYIAELQLGNDEAVWTSAARWVGLEENFIDVMQRERQYRAARNEWERYNIWKKNRNPKRAELEQKFGFDCYSDDTEFLTEAGWKTFDEVKDTDGLATVYIGETNTVHKWGTIEYQQYTEKFDGTFTGNLYHFTGTHTDTLVTPNHRMLVRPLEKNTGRKGEFALTEAAHVTNFFETLRTITPKTKTYGTYKIFEDIPIPPTSFMRLMGWYLSDGTAHLRKNKLKDISISQKKGGRLSQSMLKFKNKYKNMASCNLYEYKRKPTRFRSYEIVEQKLSVRNKQIVNKIYEDCGSVKSKRIPRWVFGLSKSLMEELFDAMVKGDGTIRKTSFESIIYYTTLPGLADDVHELATLCGWETSKWGPYEDDRNGYKCKMWQIHVNKNTSQFKTMQRCYNVQKIAVKDHRIVCFTVPNGTLVTRRNGKVSFHGNSKHGAHLVRLLRMGEEILMTGKVNVWRGDIDREELLAIRNGAWTYEQLLEWTDAQEKELNNIYNSGQYCIPKTPDKNAIDNLCIELVEQALKEGT